MAAFTSPTTEEETIRKWWGYWPKAMIGVPMGARIRRLGNRSRSTEGAWRTRWSRVSWLTSSKSTALCRIYVLELTPRHGFHILFKWDQARPVTNSPGALARTNIDVRGEGGYIIVAPSVCVGDGKHEERRRTILRFL